MITVDKLFKAMNIIRSYLVLAKRIAVNVSSEDHLEFPISPLWRTYIHLSIFIYLVIFVNYSTTPQVSVETMSVAGIE